MRVRCRMAALFAAIVVAGTAHAELNLIGAKRR